MKVGFINIKLVVYTNSDLIISYRFLVHSWTVSFMVLSKHLPSLTSQRAQLWEMHISFVRASCPYIWILETWESWKWELPCGDGGRRVRSPSPPFPTVGAANVPSFATTEHCFFYPLQGNSGPPGTVGQKGDPGYPGPSVSTCWFPSSCLWGGCLVCGPRKLSTISSQRRCLHLCCYCCFFLTTSLLIPQWRKELLSTWHSAVQGILQFASTIPWCSFLVWDLCREQKKENTPY